MLMLYEDNVIKLFCDNKGWWVWRISAMKVLQKQ